MNEEQYKEFGMIAQQCDSRQYNSINVASNARSDAIVAAFHELTRLREQRDRLLDVCKDLVARGDGNMAVPGDLVEIYDAALYAIEKTEVDTQAE